MTKDLDGKVFLVTGATEGIGKAAALEFAKRGANLTIVGRNREKTERVLAELKAASGSEQLELLVGDLSKLADIRAVAAAFRAKHDRLDVLVNNAGAVFATHQLSADGLEMTFALNHVGYFLLTHELLDLVKKTPGARVVSTSSGAQQAGRIDFEVLAKRPKGDAGFRVYCDSKLANVLFTRALAKRLGGTGATANCFHPGFVQTGFAMNNPGLLKSAIKVVASLFARTPEKGAETLVWLATSPEAAKTTGEYFHDRKVAKVQKLGRDDALAEHLWAFSEKVCGLA
jgi:NAD(P)-dependent dehydrogenase (short-subunit alcohol dehydrogenase family)